MVADDVGKILGLQVKRRHRRPEMIVQRLAQMARSVRLRRELHQAGQVVAALHV